MEDFQVGVLRGPVAIAVTGGEGFFYGFEAFGFAAEDAVGAGGVVESVGVVGTKGNGGLQVADAFIGIAATVGEIGGEQDAGADVFGDELELIAKEPGRRAVLALTDGEDTFSQSATLDTVVVAARKLGVPVHTLGLGSEDEIESDALKKLAVSTRGQYYPARAADQPGLFE